MNNNINEFYKKNESDLIWWIDNRDKVGEHLFSFDKKTIFNLFQDYPYKLTNDEKKIFDKENPYWVDFFKDRNKNEEVSIQEVENKNSNSLNKQPFRLSQLKYTKHHWNSGSIVNGTSLTTSIEIKSEMLSDIWKLSVIHKYLLEDNFEEKVITDEYDLPNQQEIISELEKNDLRDLKNNYFSDDKIQRYSHWELEYNNYFKISGTFDCEPEQIKKITSILNCESIINKQIDKVKEIIKSIEEKKKLLYSIVENSYKEIEKMPANTEFTIQQFLKDYEIEENDSFYLCKQIIAYCSVHNIKIEEKYPDSDLGLPWNIPRIKK